MCITVADNQHGPGQGYQGLACKAVLPKNNNSAALREYRRIKGIRRGSLSVPRLKNMIRRFELTGDLGIALGEADGKLSQKVLKKLPYHG